MRHVTVWLAGERSTVAHREIQDAQDPRRHLSTACGVTTVDRTIAARPVGIRIDWQLLNPRKVRLCQKCWSPLAVKLAEKVPDFPPCEVAS